MAEMGHTDPGLALSIYAHAMRREEGENEALRLVVAGGVRLQHESTADLTDRRFVGPSVGCRADRSKGTNVQPVAGESLL
jgi:hypothetical protein